MGRPLLVIMHVDVFSFAVLHHVERVLFGIDPDDDLFSCPLPSSGAQVRNPIVGIVTRDSIDAGDMNVGHAVYLGFPRGGAAVTGPPDRSSKSDFDSDGDGRQRAGEIGGRALSDALGVTLPIAGHLFGPAERHGDARQSQRRKANISQP